MKLSSSPGRAALLGLTLLALYPTDAPALPWDVLYPEDSRVIQLVAHDSQKRGSPRRRAMVYQAHARFSRDHLAGIVANPIDVVIAQMNAIGAISIIIDPKHTSPLEWTVAENDDPEHVLAIILRKLEEEGILSATLDFEI